MAQFISSRMASANEGKRLLYCELLAMLGSERSVETLWQAVGDRSPAVRIAAAISLAARGEVANLGALIEKLGRRARRSARLTILFDQLVPERTAEVRAVARDETLAPRVRLSAFQALIASSESEYRALVPEMARDRSPAIAAIASRMLIDGPHPEAAPLIAELLGHRDARVRREAAEAAARLGSARPTLELRHALKDRDALVHAAAARSLVHFAQGTAPRGGSQLARPAPTPALAAPAG
jgi:HEAT repeat protein